MGDMTDRPADRPTPDPQPGANGRVPLPAEYARQHRQANRPTLRQKIARLFAGTPTVETDNIPTAPPVEPTALRIGLPAAVWTLSAITSLLAATGQIGFARWAGVTDWRQYLVPAGLELVAGAFMLLGYRRARRGHSPALMWTFATTVGGFAIYTNVVHAGPRAGLLFGAATAITLLLWFAKLYDDYRDFRELIDEDGLGLLWLFNTRLAFRALLVGRRLRIRKITRMLTFAEVWIAVHDDAKRAGIKGWRLRRRTAWRSVMRAAGHPVADLPTFATVDRVSVVETPTPKPAPTATPAVASDRQPPDPSPRTATARPKAIRAKPTHLRRVYSPEVIANARHLRETYGDRLPSAYRVRTDTGWSYDRAKPAIEAHGGGADLTDDDPKEESHDRHFAAAGA